MSIQDTHYVYLVKRQVPFYSNGTTNLLDEVIDICSTLDKAMSYVDMPNWDIIVTRYNLDCGPDSEVLMCNVDKRAKI